MTPRPKSVLAELPAAFANSITLSMTVVSGFLWAEAIKSLFAEGGPLFTKSLYAPWITAAIMTVLAVVVGRLAGYKTSPISTPLPNRSPPPTVAPTESPMPFPFTKQQTVPPS